MSASVVLMVLSAAFLHAFWNAVVKGAADRTIMLGMIALGHFVPGVIVVMLAPMPDLASIPYILASVIIHWVYFYLLHVAYRLGDLSLIYPIARGLSPVLVALGAQLWVGEVLPFAAWMGILAVSAGIMVLTRDVLHGALPVAGVAAALAIGVIVTVYTLVDGVGARLSGNAISYIGWLFTTKILIVIYVFSTRMDRLQTTSLRTLVLGFAGGLVSSSAYALVLYAKTIAPLGVVSALRETSVIFAALIGVMWFGEGPKRRRVLAAGIVCGGIICIGLSK